MKYERSIAADTFEIEAMGRFRLQLYIALYGRPQYSFTMPLYKRFSQQVYKYM